MDEEDVKWSRGTLDDRIFGELRINRNGYLESESHRQCTNCLSIFERHSPTMKICKPCNSARVKSQSAVMKMYRRAKSRASEKGLEFSIIPEDIVIPKKCPILGVPLYTTSGKPGAFLHSPSLDRINSYEGYTKENIWVISQCANSMKGKASEDQLVRFAQWVLSHYRDIDIKDI